MEQLQNVMVEADKNVQVREFDLVAPSSSSSFESGNSSESSLGSDSFDEVTSPAASSSSSSDGLATDPLSDMSTLFQQLPIKRGLSKYYQGKAQSFTSLAKVSSLEDLAKPESPYKKKLKCCRSYGGGMGDESHNAKCTTNNAISSSRHGSKRGLHSRGSCSSLMSAKRGSDNFMGSRPPIPPHRSTSSNTIPNQAVLLV